MPITSFNRTRQTVTLHKKVASFIRNGPSGAASGSFLEGSVPMKASDVQYGYKDSDWRTKIVNRTNASLAYTARRTYVSRLGSMTIRCGQWYDYYPGYYTWRNFTTSLRYSPDVSDFLSEGLDFNLDQLALKRLKSKIASQTGQMNALVPLVEVREMRGLLKSLAFSALDVTKALVDIKRTKGRSAYKFASHAWLTWSFAVKPTLSEIEQISDSIKLFYDENNRPMYYASGSAKSVENRQIKFYNAPETLITRDVYGSSVRIERSCRYKAGFRIPVRSANGYGLGSQLGLEFGSLPSAAWELTAFSWLFDYFTTAGEYFDDTFTGDGVESIYCDRTYRVRHIFTLDVDRPPPSAFGAANGRFTFWYKENSEPTIVESHYISRSPFGSKIPSRAFRFRSVDEIGKNAVNKLLNLGSVLVGGKAFSSKVRL